MRPISVAALAVLPRFAAAFVHTSSVNPQEWAALNKTVNGKLHTAAPLALPCFTNFENNAVSVDTQACSTVQAGYTIPSFRVSRYEARMQPQWESCQSTNQRCELDNTNTTNPTAFVGAECFQGSISPYYIDIRNASDVQAAFEFVEKTDVLVSIKNTGHDYIGRSTAQGSLALWTRNLDSLSYEENFIPEGCKADSSSSSYKAITTGAGVIFDDLYQFAESKNVTFVGGYAQTVGISGGWIMGGGHSVLTPTLGLGVDRVVQFKIVTPDGEFRVANECQNEDLFWALRGGGGGTFGVVLESTHHVEEQITLQVATVAFNGTTSNIKQFYSILVNNTVKWSNEGWGGHVQGAGFIYVTPKISLAEAQASMQPMFDFIESQGGKTVLETQPSWYGFYEKFVVSAEVTVGRQFALSSRLIPKSNFESAQGREQLIDILASYLPIGLAYIPVVGPLLYNATAGATSVTPAWRDSIWELSVNTVGWTYNSSVSEIEAVYDNLANLTAAMTDLAPNSGAYINEADVYETDYQTSFWGPNYPRLLEIKNKYDPNGILDCWHCVGWKGASDPRFSCYLSGPST